MYVSGLCDVTALKSCHIIGCRFNTVSSSSWLRSRTRHFTRHRTAPPYLSDECQFMSDADRRLRSSAVPSFVVPRSRTRLADRSFVVADPRLWNTVPASVHLREDSEYFKRLLKAHLIQAAALNDFCIQAPVNKKVLLTQLLKMHYRQRIFLTKFEGDTTTCYGVTTVCPTYSENETVRTGERTAVVFSNLAKEFTMSYVKNTEIPGQGHNVKQNFNSKSAKTRQQADRNIKNMMKIFIVGGRCR